MQCWQIFANTCKFCDNAFKLGLNLFVWGRLHWDSTDSIPSLIWIISYNFGPLLNFGLRLGKYVKFCKLGWQATFKEGKRNEGKRNNFDAIIDLRYVK